MRETGWHCVVGQGDREVTRDLWLFSAFSSALPFHSLPASFPFPLALSPPFPLPNPPSPFLALDPRCPQGSRNTLCTKP